MWKFDICEDWDIIWGSHYQERWNKLLDISPTAHVFFHPSLVRAWINTYRPLRKLSPIFIWGKDSNSGNEAFIPFVLWRKNWKNLFIRSIVSVGYSDYDYHNPIFQNLPSDIDAFWSSVINLLKSYSTDNIIIDGIVDTYKGRGDSNWQRKEPCPYLDLSSLRCENDLMAFFKTSLRGDIRRQIRRLNEIGNLTVREYDTMVDINKTFPAFMKEHSLRWPMAYKAPNFHINMLREGKAVTHFSSLDVNGQPIAWHLGFEYRGVYYYYMPVGDHEYSKFSPTKVHLFYLIKRAIERGMTKFDHLRGEETYKLGFSNGVDYVNSINIQNPLFLSQFKLESNKIIRHILR